jgi:polyisoprenoid-binding protein YceI
MRRLLILATTLLTIGAVGVGVLVVVTMLRSDDPDLLTSAPEITPAPDVGNGGGATTSADGIFHFVIDQASSEVKYVVRETLRGVVGANAVGTTNAITGDLYLTDEGLAAGQTSSFSVDLRQLRTDESMRDNYVRQNVLQTSQYPTANFVAESISGFPSSYAEGQEAAMTLSGTLTIHGVSKQVEWEVKARRAGDTLSGIADLSFNMSEYGITPPNVPIARAEDGVQLQITILARLAA